VAVSTNGTRTFRAHMQGFSPWRPTAADITNIPAAAQTHYWANDAFLTEGKEVLSRMVTISHIPAVLIHGRHDISGPPITPWRLHEQWPSSRLVIIEREGHGRPETMDEMCRVIDAFSFQ
jgi:proline iminopeptidase